MHTSVPAPCTFRELACARDFQAAPWQSQAAPTRWEGAEPNYGNTGPLALPDALRLLGQRGLGLPLRCSLASSVRGPWPLCRCSVETAPATSCPPRRRQLKPSLRGKVLAQLSMRRHPGMSGHTPCSLLIYAAVPLEARKSWTRLAKGTGRAVFCLWSSSSLGAPTDTHEWEGEDPT